MKKFIVCGGRDFNDREFLFRALNSLLSICGPYEIIHGDAKGADRLAGQFGQVNKLEVTVVPADWDKHGRSAGPIRNGEMLKLKPDAIIAFPGGRGTENMCRIAEKAGIMTWNPYISIQKSK